MTGPTLQLSMEEMMPLIREKLEAGQSICFFPRGTSMRPMLREGMDSIELSPLPETLKKYDLPLYRRRDGTYVLHRIIRTGETFTCMGDNQFRAEPGLTRDQMIGVVTAFCRGETRHAVTEPTYRLYCRLWHFSRPVRHLWRRGKSWLRRKLL